MAQLPKRSIERFSKSIGKFQKVLKKAKDRDVNESDTVSIVTDILADVFGYDKYLEVTSEFAIKSTYCDLAIKIDGNIEFLIEVKAIGIDLKDNHLSQVVNYAANHGTQWIILTNGLIWEIYKIRFERPIGCDLVCTIDFPEIIAKKKEDQEKLFIICKEGLNKGARKDFFEKVQSVNRFVAGALIRNDAVVNVIRKELRKMSPGIKVDNMEIGKLLQSEVLKRDVIDGEEAMKAMKRVKRFYNKVSRGNKKKEKTNKENAVLEKGNDAVTE